MEQILGPAARLPPFDDPVWQDDTVEDEFTPSPVDEEAAAAEMMDDDAMDLDSDQEKAMEEDPTEALEDRIFDGDEALVPDPSDESREYLAVMFGYGNISYQMLCVSYGLVKPDAFDSRFDPDGYEYDMKHWTGQMGLLKAHFVQQLAGLWTPSGQPVRVDDYRLHSGVDGTALDDSCNIRDYAKKTIAGTHFADLAYSSSNKKKTLIFTFRFVLTAAAVTTLPRTMPGARIRDAESKKTVTLTEEHYIWALNIDAIQTLLDNAFLAWPHEYGVDPQDRHFITLPFYGLDRDGIMVFS